MTLMTGTSWETVCTKTLVTHTKADIREDRTHRTFGRRAVRLSGPNFCQLGRDFVATVR